jgi:metal-responsive CopG/Arc/MetJ family transcriptional regulator
LTSYYIVVNLLISKTKEVAMNAVSKSISIPADLLTRADDQAHAEKTTLSALIQKAMVIYLNNVEQKQRRRA